MAGKTKKKPVTKRKSSPARKAGRGFLGMVQIKRTKRYTRIIITIPVIHWPVTPKKRKSRRRKQPLLPLAVKRSASIGFTFCLLGISLFGLWQLTNAFLATSSAAPVPSVPHPRNTPAPRQPGGLKRSRPLRLEIPDIHVDTELVGVGKNADGTLGVPDDHDKAGWYEFAPTPGEVGPAIIDGHYNSLIGEAVFYHLGDLVPGNLINITRDDGQIITFKVDKTELFDQANFPTEAVYGNIAYPGLRLITCGGDFNYVTRHYSHNVVVYATLIRPKL